LPPFGRLHDSAYVNANITENQKILESMFHSYALKDIAISPHEQVFDTEYPQINANVTALGL
jgi:hypothetical protein